MENPVKVKIIEAIKEGRFKNIYDASVQLGINPITFYGLLSGTKISRPLVLKIAEAFNDPALVFWYEKYLQNRKKPKGGKIG